MPSKSTVANAHRAKHARVAVKVVGAEAVAASVVSAVTVHPMATQPLRQTQPLQII